MDITTFLSNLADLAVRGEVLIGVFCYMVSAYLVLKFIFELLTVSEGKLSISTPIMTFVAAACFGAFPAYIDVLVGTYTEQWTPIAYVQTSVGSANQLKPVLMIVQFVGYIGIIKSIFIMRDLGNPQRQREISMVSFAGYAFGGTLCVNILWTVRLIGSLTGLNVSAYVN